MNICRICLSKKPQKDILHPVKVNKNNDEKTYAEVLMFCLNIQVNTRLSTKLCLKCTNKLLSFYKFKSLALKNDEYFMTVSIDIDEDISFKSELSCDNSQDKNTNENRQEVLNDEPFEEMYVKQEDHDPSSNLESDEEFLSVIKRIKYEYVSYETKENAPAPKSSEKEKENTKLRKRKHNKISKNDTNIKQVCEECGKTVIDLKAHSYLHQPVSVRKRIKCHKCDKMFLSPNGRRKHHKIKHLGIKETCNICNKAVVSLKHHKLIVHERKSLPLECLECGRRFISKSSLELHMRMHTKDRPYECDLCEKNFISNAYLQQHKRAVHDKEKSHLCQLCSKSFFKIYHLHKHLKSHSNEKNSYECPDCGKFYKTEATLKSHREIHASIKKFSCEQCNLTFSKKDYLRSHMLSHTKEKRYPCRYCDVKFHRSDHRKRHEYTAHQKHLIITTTTST